MNKFNIPLVEGETVYVSGSGEAFGLFMFLQPNTDESNYRYGKEKIVYDKGDILKLVGDYGSIRYLFRDETSNEFVGALQLVKNQQKVCVSTIFTEKEFRGKGIASTLVKKAKQDYGRRLFISNHYTEQGALFFEVVR